MNKLPDLFDLGGLAFGALIVLLIWKGLAEVYATYFPN